MSFDENRRIARETGTVDARDLEAAKAMLRGFRPVTSEAELIRVGGPADGGYLMPDDFEGITASFSPGVARSTSFDLDIAARGIPGFLMDGSVEGLPEPHPLLTFEKRFLGAGKGRGVTSLKDWVMVSAPDHGDLLLQMDIEGAEYETLGAVSDAILARFRMIVVEFHQFHHVFDAKWRRKARPALDKLNRHFVPVHLHPNNHAPLLRQQGMVFPRVFEVTYLRRDRAYSEVVPTLPHPLDAPNLPKRENYAMPPFWDV